MAKKVSSIRQPLPVKKAATKKSAPVRPASGPKKVVKKTPPPLPPRTLPAKPSAGTPVPATRPLPKKVVPTKKSAVRPDPTSRLSESSGSSSPVPTQIPSRSTTTSVTGRPLLPVKKAGRPKPALRPLGSYAAKVEQDKGAVERFEQGSREMRAKADDLVAKAQEAAAKKRAEAVAALTGQATQQQVSAKARHGVIKARAGTGKTFSQVVGIAYMHREKLWPVVKKELGFEPVPTDQQREIWEFMREEPAYDITYCAFNKSIVQDFEKSYAWLTAALERGGVTLRFSTLHALGNRVCRANYDLGRKGVDTWKWERMIENLWGIDAREYAAGRPEKREQLQAIEELLKHVKLGMAYHNAGGALVVQNDTLDTLCGRFGLSFKDEEDKWAAYKAVGELLNMSRKWASDENLIDYNDMIWLPVQERLNVPKAQLLLVDEGQDLNVAQQQLALMAGHRIILVGDIQQAIYGFAGADTDSIPRMQTLLGETERGVHEMKLTKTRRCGKKIVELAKTLVPDFEAFEGNAEGEIVRDFPYRKLTEAMVAGDFGLCRLNAPLVRLVFALIRSGKKANIQGRNIGDGLKRIIKDSKADSIVDFIGWLDKYETQQMEKLNKSKKATEDAKVALTDRCDCLRMFCMDVVNKPGSGLKEVGERIDTIFTDEKDKDKVLLSSVHKAKGAEAYTVYILEPQLMPFVKAVQPWEKEQEMNLMYVAWTRAKRKLVFCTPAPTTVSEVYED